MPQSARELTSVRMAEVLIEASLKETFRKVARNHGYDSLMEEKFSFSDRIHMVVLDVFFQLETKDLLRFSLCCSRYGSLHAGPHGLFQLL